MYILEAPMGLGKTEAALYCAYKMLAQEKAKGIYFALPTQLTSNKIYERFNAFLANILQDDKHKALLLHSNAWLEETQMGVEGLPGNGWFNSAKRGLLAPFAVGTLDQALMAVLNVKHSFVRAFGLAGKVVILDEVHSYDAYTSEILDKLIKLLREMQCTVIILSATLNRTRRKELLNIEPKSDGYPLITKLGQEIQEIDLSYLCAAYPEMQKTVLIKHLDDTALAIEEALKRAEMGQQVLWIENTVNEAQERYLDFAARCHELNLACGLLHSRYTPNDRQINEHKWVNALGKEGWEIRQQRGCIIVGTQVLEQSLDIDADFIISRFAPTDMLLQRLGRLWRHANTPRHSNAVCEAWFLAPSLHQAIHSPQQAFGLSAAVYSEYVLCRSLEAWLDILHTKKAVCLPEDIRPLIDATYDERDEVEKLQKLKNELFLGTKNKKGLNALRQLAKHSLSQAGKTVSDLNAKTRYSEQDSSEILLLTALEPNAEKQQTVLTLLDGEKVILPWNKTALSKSQWRKLSALIMRQTVPCHQSKLPDRLLIKRCKGMGLNNVLYLGDPAFDLNVPFAIALKQLDGKLIGFEQDLSERFEYYYQQNIGLQIFKKKD